jgi:hypothetical protein
LVLLRGRRMVGNEEEEWEGCEEMTEYDYGTSTSHAEI